MISRNNQTYWTTSEQAIPCYFSHAALGYLISTPLKRNSAGFQIAHQYTPPTLYPERLPYWQKRGLFIFFLPPYSPHLNLAETWWRKIKRSGLIRKITRKRLLALCPEPMSGQCRAAANDNFSPFNLN